MAVELKAVSEELNIPVEEIRNKSLKAFLESEYRITRAEIISICQKYGVSSWEEMDELIVKDKIEEGKILEDFQKVDHLTAKATKFKKILRENQRKFYLRNLQDFKEFARQIVVSLGEKYPLDSDRVN